MNKTVPNSSSVSIRSIVHNTVFLLLLVVEAISATLGTTHALPTSVVDRGLQS
jgi:hypothetical protein